MNLPEHQRKCIWRKAKPFGLCEKFPDCVGCPKWQCVPDCPRCAVDKALAEQKAEMIAEVERKSYELMNRDDVASNTLSNIRFRTGYLTAINELLKGWGEG